MYNEICLHSFSSFSEYFVALSIVYILIGVLIVTYNSFNLILQNPSANCIGLILIMTSYLIFNEDLVFLNLLSTNNTIIIDYLSFFTKIIICLFSGLYFFIISDFLKDQKLISFEYLIIILFSILGLLIMVSSNDLLLVYLSLELSSLSLYVLAAFKKNSTYSVNSGIKYFIVGSVSSAFFLLGSSFLYGISGSINFQDLADLFRPITDCSIMFQHYNWKLDFDDTLHFLLLTDFAMWFPINVFQSYFTEIGLLFILFSLSIKLSLAPFHLWSLDVYESSPTNSTIFFAVITKLSVLIILIRICYNCFINIKSFWQSYLIWVGVFSVFVGSFAGLKQRKLKTLLAYSSVSHMGYMLLAISTSSHLGIHMFLFYILIYMISSLCVWSVVLLLKLKQKSGVTKYSKDLGDISLLKKSNSSLAIVLLITLFSIAGIPPLLGFIAKLGIFLPLVCKSYFIIALATILFSTVSTFYYIRIIKVLYFENVLVGKLYHPINIEKTAILSVLLLVLIFGVLNPTFLYLCCYKVYFTNIKCF